MLEANIREPRCQGINMLVKSFKNQGGYNEIQPMIGIVVKRNSYQVMRDKFVKVYSLAEVKAWEAEHLVPDVYKHWKEFDVEKQRKVKPHNFLEIEEDEQVIIIEGNHR